MNGDPEDPFPRLRPFREAILSCSPYNFCSDPALPEQFLLLRFNRREMLIGIRTARVPGGAWEGFGVHGFTVPLESPFVSGKRKGESVVENSTGKAEFPREIVARLHGKPASPRNQISRRSYRAVCRADAVHARFPARERRRTRFSMRIHSRACSFRPSGRSIDVEACSDGVFPRRFLRQKWSSFDR